MTKLRTLGQKGFSLLEVLVALVVLSIGLLGLAGLQTFAFNFNHQSYERTQATLFLYDIIDRMRANRDNPSLYATLYATAPLPAGSYPNCAVNSCANASDLAAFDINQWKTALSAQKALRNGEGQITVNGTTVTVQIRWQENDINVVQQMTAIL